MSRNRKISKGRRETFTRIPHLVDHSPAHAALSPRAKALLGNLASQYNGYNNGHLAASWSVMKPLGWRSKSTLSLAITELLERGWIVRTRLGGMNNRRSLYAITWLAINDGRGKYDAGITPTDKPLDKWRSGEATSVFRPRHPNRAEQAGRKAHATGAPLENCPYRETTKGLVPLWQKGWLLAQQEAEAANV